MGIVMSKHIMPPLISVCVLFFIVCIEIVAGSLGTKDDISIPVISGNNEISENSELNESEKVILNMLSSRILLKDTKSITADNEYTIYVKYLHNYLSSTGVTLSSSKAYEALNKIIELNAIINIEHVSSFNKMSVDGKELALNLAQKIYDLCGLKLNYDIHGNINQILDQSGNFIYQNENTVQNTGIQFKALMITLVVIMILLGLCILIARKNQLFIKEVTYDGFKEEGFVQ